MREPVAVFGGSFDPVHMGHIRIAEELIYRTDYNSVIWVPAACNPLKTNRPKVSDFHRLAMLENALEAFDWSYISDIELQRGGVSYTLDTLLELRKIYKLEQPIGFLLGDDAFCSLPDWFGYDRLIQLSEFLVFNRTGELHLDIETHEQRLFSDGGRMQRIDMPEILISSSEIRSKTAVFDLKDSISDFLPVSVFNYIISRNLYGARSYSLLKRQIKAVLSEKRYVHTISVEHTASVLAELHNVDIEVARLAAVAHDLTREWTPDHLIEYTQVHGLDAEKYQIDQPVLLHGLVAAAIIEETYGICNESILDAVCHHTLGCAGLNKIGQVLYVADYIEPDRGIFSVDEILALQKMELSQSCMQVIEDQKKRFGALLPATDSFYHWLMED